MDDNDEREAVLVDDSFLELAARCEWREVDDLCLLKVSSDSQRFRLGCGGGNTVDERLKKLKRP